MTAEIGNFRVTNEGSSAAGVRRIEVVTGREADALIDARLHTLQQAAELLHTRPDELIASVRQLQAQNSTLQRELQQMRQQMAQQQTQSLLDQAVQVDGVAVLATEVAAADVDTMRQMTDWFRDKLGSAVVVVGSVVDEKPMLVAAVTDDIIQRGVKAGDLIRDAAKIIGGGGGGRPNMAQAGGKDSAKLSDALASIAPWVEEKLRV